MKKNFQNLVVDHMTFLVEPRFYNVTYLIFRVIFGVGAEDVLYEKRKTWPGQPSEKSMTFAARIGRYGTDRELNQSIIAVVEPTEPAGQSSHVREILKNRGGSAHWQHIAFRTPDLLAFHDFARERGVNFITPIMKDQTENLIQVFSGEWNLPGAKPTGIFFEFIQRNPSKALLNKITSGASSGARQAWFRDKTFLGLYQQKEEEYRSGEITPFIDEELFAMLEKAVSGKPLWKITQKDVDAAEALMRDYVQDQLDADLAASA